MAGGANVGQLWLSANGTISLAPNRKRVNSPGRPTQAAEGPEPTLALQRNEVCEPAVESPPSADDWGVIGRIHKQTAVQHQRHLEELAERHRALLDMSLQMMATIVSDQTVVSQSLTSAPTVVLLAPDVGAGAPPEGPELASLRTPEDVVNSLGDSTSGRITKHAVGVQHSAVLAAASVGLRCTEVAFRAVLAGGTAMAGLRDGDVFITREDPIFADALERLMRTHGIRARVIDEVPDEAGAVICLAALAQASSPDDCVAMHVRAFHGARSVAKSSSGSRLFVTVQSTGARFAEANVPVGVASLVKTAAWEWPNASVRAIDIESLDPERLLAELLAGGSGVQVALRDDGTRLIVDDVEASPVQETISVARSGVVVVTGGARGVTAPAALALAKRHGLRLVLLGRTALPDTMPDGPSGTTVAEIVRALLTSADPGAKAMSLPRARERAEWLIAEREVRATLSTAQAQGTPARYFAASITDEAAVCGVLDEVRQNFGPIVGVVHGAGVPGDNRLEDLDDEQFVKVFNTKLIGAEALLGATSTDDLRFISLFSSIAARTGKSGQSADASANAVLEAIAARESARRKGACVVRAFGWGPWDGATVESRSLGGVGVIPIAEGAQFFAEHALRRSSAPVVMVAAPAARPLQAARLQWDVSAEILPVLADHRVRGRVVVPVVIVLDAMLRAARGLVVNERPVVRDFQVLSGVTLSEREQLTLTIGFDAPATGSSYSVTIRDADGRQRYRAIVETEPDESPSVFVPEIAGSAWPMSTDDAYAGPLFHGPHFAAIQHLDTFGTAGGTAILKSRGELGWAESGWAIDPASMDGGLQLGLLWASAHGRSLMLPQRIGRVVLNHPFPENTNLRCRLAAHPISDRSVEFDVVFETMDGAPVAALEGVEFYAAGPPAD
ncbi:SDR family NAD(P)-dependent oxidoreductase [Mycobacterium sp. CVI_P3]|uniref:SDR family NAD(P)-dependent oxidoreductase n=1 Tax=Mycobacterium pinniadriaticum TaxID=2994102 RepID=A0ABT3SLL4_9MYCO|nr:SDR family NAD(P)-dependent oxidoreductase [Mycobacterium pinniadriaticum]MCX2933990.1 SDR family NAD(P)-dependent oxidoreductase [Mycobacterium pinniadriaticum]MCX2940414.1 SDR family NAD(P)-dependent oxidoreductase [Mycobacterium pinniadriaticum]